MKIKQLREITGLSQQQFANKFKIPVNSLRNWEQKKRSPPEYLPGMIEEIMRLEAELNERKETTNYKPLTDEEIINDDAAAAEPKTNKELLKKMKDSLEEIDIDDLYCENCIYGEKCNYDYDNCETYQGHYRACNIIENWIYWKELERMIENV